MQDLSVQPRPVVLIIDNSKMIRMSMGRVLSDEFEVLEAGDGLEGLTKLRSDDRINLVLTDAEMPKLSGQEFLELVRGDEDVRVRQTAVLFVTGSEDEAGRDLALKSGATDFITKPFDRAELLARVRIHVRVHQISSIQATFDAISGLTTKSYFLQHGEQDLAFAKRHDSEMSIISLCIDNYDDLFSDFEDEYKNTLIRGVADLLKNAMRREDTVSRFKNGEFGIIAPTAGLAESYVICDRIRTRLAETGITVGSEQVNVTMSMGLVCLPDLVLDDMNSYIDTAVNRMFQAQEQGGGQIFSDDEGEENVPEPKTNKVVSVDAAIKLLKKGDGARLKPYVPRLIDRVLLLLDFCVAESEPELAEHIESIALKLKD